MPETEDHHAIIEQQLSPPKSTLNGCLESTTDVFKKISIEPFIFIWAFGHTIVATPTSSLYFDKVCKVGSVWFGDGSTYPDEVCDHIDNGTFNEVQDYVQGTVADMHLVVSLFQGIPPIIFVLFIGPWSDKFGRKALVILPTTGYLLYSISYLFAVIFFYELPAEFLMLEITRDLLGGDMCLWMGAYSYISDVSPDKTRTMRISFVDFSFFIALSIGNGVSGPILTEIGYTAIYAIASATHIIAILYCIFVMKDSRKLREKRIKQQESSEAKKRTETKRRDATENEDCQTQDFFQELKAIFNLKNMKQSFGTALKYRPNGMRHILILLVIVYGCFGFSNHVNLLSNQYSRKKFEWESSDEFNLWWSTYSAVGNIFAILAIGFFGPIMTHFLKFSDCLILIISLVSNLIGIMTIQLSNVASTLYLASALKMFSNVTTVAARSMMTKIVGPMEIGRIFACTGAIGAVATLANPIYQAVYSATLQWYFGFVYCISDMVGMLDLFIALYIYFFLWRQKRRAGEIVFSPMS